MNYDNLSFMHIVSIVCSWQIYPGLLFRNQVGLFQVVLGSSLNPVSQTEQTDMSPGSPHSPGVHDNYSQFMDSQVPANMVHGMAQFQLNFDMACQNNKYSESV